MHVTSIASENLLKQNEKRKQKKEEKTTMQRKKNQRRTKKEFPLYRTSIYIPSIEQWRKTFDIDYKRRCQVIW